jgi:hypothetical protein
MSLIGQFFIVSMLVQIAHSIEEITTGFHKKWYLLKMPLWVFLTLEIIFESFWIGVWLWQSFPFRVQFQAFFLILMFANGIQHVVWTGSTKKYVPGLVTAVIHIILFTIFYFKILF